MANIEGGQQFDALGLMADVSRLIPDTLAVSRGGNSELWGLWYAIPEKGVIGGAINRKGTARISETAPAKNLDVEIEEYADIIAGDTIVESGKRTYTIGNLLFISSDNSRNIAQVIQYCEGSGLISPNVIPEVARRLEADGHYQNLLKNWKSWGVTQ